MTTFAEAPTTGHDDTSRSRLLRALDARRPGHTLPAALYTDPALHDLDVGLLWSRQWIFVGSVAELPEAGDYLTVTVGAASVIVVRDDNEQVRAFHNVCRHRGARLLTADRGSVGNIVCGYHRWTYDTEGRLVSAPGLVGTDPACLGLRSVHVRDIAGLLFLCLAVDPPEDIDDVARILTPYFLPHGLASAKVAAQIDVVEDGNWKLTMENNRECYHCENGHPDLTCTFFPTWGLNDDQVPPRLRASHDRYLVADADLQRRCEEQGLITSPVEDLVDRPLGFRVERTPLDGAGESFSLDGAGLVGRLLGSVTDPRMGRLGLHTQPNAWFHVLSDHAVTFAVLPLSVDRTLVRTTWLVDADAKEGVDYDVDELTRVWRHTNEEDAAFVALAQAGVSDPAYEPGPYTESERQVDAFVQWYVARMREELPP